MKDINYSDIYILNPYYKFRSDIKRIILTNNDSLKCDTNNLNITKNITSDFAWVTHPFIAYYFSFFDGSENLQKTIEKLASTINLTVDEITKSIIPFIENTENLICPLPKSDLAFSIPKNFLIKQQGKIHIRNILKNININKILKDLDLITMRFYIPNDFTLMINNKCYTDCIYCYADTKHKVTKYLSFGRIKELIHEAKKLQIRDIPLDGGDVFLYRDWYELFKELKVNGYMPMPSTKVPIIEEQIKKLKELDVKQIQISLDTISEKNISKLLGVNNTYLTLIKDTLKNLEKYDIKFRVKSVITKYNDDLKSFKNFLYFLMNFKNIDAISIAPGDYTHNKDFGFKSSKGKIKKIEDYVDTIKKDFPNIQMQGYLTRLDDLTFEEKMKRFNDRGLCSGNLTGFFVLPDGKVTLCEQLYWHPFFIIGDLNKQSIMGMWNSKKALDLWNISQDKIKSESPCHTCSFFENCRRGKGNCWKLAIFAYGNENYDYPSPDCPFAPSNTRNIYI